MEDNLQAATRQSTRLKAELKGSQQEKDSLKREVALLHKKLLHVQEKVSALSAGPSSSPLLPLRTHLCVCWQNHSLEAALHTGGLQSHGKKEAVRLKEQEQRLLRQENERLQADARGLRNELLQAREKVSPAPSACRRHALQT